ncbi:unnamed protein product [Jaminaea pallidilutea]
MERLEKECRSKLLQPQARNISTTGIAGLVQSQSPSGGSCLDMASSNGRAAPRQPTPTSPSPSPSPTATPAGPGAQPSAAASNTAGDVYSGLPTGGLKGDNDEPPIPGKDPFHTLLQLPDDPNEPHRARVEDCTRNVIDSLYQLAVCAADVQAGREDIILARVNETIANLSSLSASSADQDLLPLIPEEVLEAIDEGRNPDAWSKNRMARLVSDNQQLAGQRWAIEEYRQKLSSSVLKEFPELAGPLEEMEQEHRQQRTEPPGQLVELQGEAVKGVRGALEEGQQGQQWQQGQQRQQVQQVQQQVDVKHEDQRGDQDVEMAG